MGSDHKPRQRAVVSFTGGKDCHLAIARAYERSDLEVVGLVCFHPPGQPRFKAHPIKIQHQQAEALGLPLWMIVVDAEKHGSYLQAYGAALQEMRETHKIDLIITGDIDLIGTSKVNFVTDVCEKTECGVSCWLPLWQVTRREALQEMWARGFDIRFSCVKSPYFDGSWIGRQLDGAALTTLSPFEAQGLDLCGENGEYHTLVVDGGPILYKTKILVPRHPLVAQELEKLPGQKDGQRWWVCQESEESPYQLVDRSDGTI